MKLDDFHHQQIRELNWSLMGENHSEFGKYLQTVWKEGKGWDQLYQEVILADYRNDQASGAPAFLKKRVSDLDRLTNDVAIQFLESTLVVPNATIIPMCRIGHKPVTMA